MKSLLLPCGLISFALAGNTLSRAEETGVSVYVVDHSAEYAESGGVCLPYTSAEKPGPSREILAIAQGPPGSTLFIIAFDRDTPHLGLAPVVVEQTADSKPVRFPAVGSTWPYEKPAGLVDLYVAVFDKADPDLAKLTEYAEWLTDALKEKNEVEALLHAEVIKKRLSNLLRQRGVDEYRVKFGTELTSLREQSTSKAATTRGNTGVLPAAGKSDPKVPVAVVRRNLKTLDDEWREDSRAIPFGLATPGVLVFPLVTPPAP